MLGSAEDQGVKVRGRLLSPKILFAQGRGMGGIEEQRKEDPFAVNDKILNSKHTLDSKSLFGEEESGDESNMTSSKDDEDDSLNGGRKIQGKNH